jgi:hypothetical protein
LRTDLGEKNSESWKSRPDEPCVLGFEDGGGGRRGRGIGRKRNTSRTGVLSKLAAYNINIKVSCPFMFVANH